MNIFERTRRQRAVFHIDLGDTRIELNREGFVADPCTWTKEVAEHMAHGDGLALTEAHWEVIDYLRGYFEKYQIAPMVKILAKEIGKLRPDKNSAQHLYRLFPDGVAKQACRYAGLPRATGCV